MSHIGDFFRGRRQEMGVTTGELARSVGYRNLNKGKKRLQTFEGGGKVAPDLLDKLATALEVSPDEVRRLADEDYREWLRWANELVRSYVVLRFMACVYQRIELPDEALEPGPAEV